MTIPSEMLNYRDIRHIISAIYLYFTPFTAINIRVYSSDFVSVSRSALVAVCYCSNCLPSTKLTYFYLT